MLQESLMPGMQKKLEQRIEDIQIAIKHGVDRKL